MAKYIPPRQSKIGQVFDVLVLLVLTIGALYAPLLLGPAVNLGPLPHLVLTHHQRIRKPRLASHALKERAPVRQALGRGAQAQVHRAGVSTQPAVALHQRLNALDLGARL